MKHETSADDALRKMQSNYRSGADFTISILTPCCSTYKLIEMKLNQSKASLKNKLPDIQKALEMVQYLASRVGCLSEPCFLKLTSVQERNGRSCYDTF